MATESLPHEPWTLSTFPEPDDWQGWVNLWCGQDTGNIDCVPECLRHYVADAVTPEGWFKKPCAFPTPYVLARWYHTTPKVPWSGTGWGPADIKRMWYEVEPAPAPAPPVSKQLEGYPDLYFIRSAGGPIKIGVSDNVTKRLRGLQTSSPYKLELACLVKGGAMQEPEYHALFAAHRLEGEWFSPAPEIEAEITRLAQPIPAPFDRLTTLEQAA